MTEKEESDDMNLKLEELDEKSPICELQKVLSRVPSV
jgi:hypothetical protein